MSVTQQEHNTVPVSPREGKLAGFAKASVTPMSIDDLAERRSGGTLRMIQLAIDGIEPSHGLNQSRLALRNLSQARALLLQGSLVKHPN